MVTVAQRHAFADPRPDAPAGVPRYEDRTAAGHCTPAALVNTLSVVVHPGRFRTHKTGSAGHTEHVERLGGPRAAPYRSMAGLRAHRRRSERRTIGFFAVDWHHESRDQGQGFLRPHFGPTSDHGQKVWGSNPYRRADQDWPLTRNNSGQGPSLSPRPVSALRTPKSAPPGLTRGGSRVESDAAASDLALRSPRPFRRGPSLLHPAPTVLVIERSAHMTRFGNPSEEAVRRTTPVPGCG